MLELIVSVSVDGNALVTFVPYFIEYKISVFF